MSDIRVYSFWTFLETSFFLYVIIGAKVETAGGYNGFDEKDHVSDDKDLSLQKKIISQWAQSHPLCVTNITAYAGQTAVMHCCLARFDRHLSVSWIRIKEDVIVLTHGHSVFTTDDRINVGNDQNGVWSLSISRVGQEDIGQYECQTNTEVKTSVVVNLDVFETTAEIVGSKRRLIMEGSTIRLTCKVYLGEKGPDPHYRDTAVVHWFHDQRLLDPVLEPRIMTRTEIGKALKGWLEIQNAALPDAGNYSCVPSYAIPDWSQVHIIHDEKSSVFYEEMSEVKLDTSSVIISSSPSPDGHHCLSLRIYFFILLFGLQ